LYIYSKVLKNVATIINSLPDNVEYLEINFITDDDINNIIKLPKNIKTFTDDRDLNISIENYNYNAWKKYFPALQQN
jgi:hypothetical protein